VLLAGGGAVHAASYTVTSFGAGFSPDDINNLGQVVGNYKTPPSGSNPWLYSGGTLTLLTAPLTAGLGYTSITAVGLNDRGQMVGFGGTAQNNDATPNAFVYDTATGSATRIAAPAGMLYVQPTGINAAGVVSGTALDGTSLRRVVEYGAGQTTDLGQFDGNPSQARGIDASGRIAGYSDNGVSQTAYVRQPGGGATAVFSGMATGINDAGHVSGQTSGAAPHALLYADGRTIDIDPLLAGSQRSFANSLNNGDQVVGYFFKDGVQTAFLYADGAAVSLDSLIDSASGWSLRNARAINDRGQVIGQGVFNGVNTGFLLTPVAAVPEPATLALLLGGLGLIAVCRRGRSIATSPAAPSAP
jgi:probable HAF family extracellular repeat protein